MFQEAIFCGTNDYLYNHFRHVANISDFKHIYKFTKIITDASFIMFLISCSNDH